MRTFKIWTKEAGLLTVKHETLTKFWQDYTWHREDGPAFFEYYPGGGRKTVSWFVDHTRHRIDGPAITDYEPAGSLKSTEWFKNGFMHREDGPASTWYSAGEVKSSEIWWLEGRIHRYDGPAEIRYSKNGRSMKIKLWRIHNIYVDPREIEKELGVSILSAEAQMYLRLKYPVPQCID